MQKHECTVKEIFSLKTPDMQGDPGLVSGTGENRVDKGCSSNGRYSLFHRIN